MKSQEHRFSNQISFLLSKVVKGYILKQYRDQLEVDQVSIKSHFSIMKFDSVS